MRRLFQAGLSSETLNQWADISRAGQRAARPLSSRAGRIDRNIDSIYAKIQCLCEEIDTFLLQFLL